MAKSSSKYNKFLKPFKNVFVLILIMFCVWMLFFDTHSLFLHRELNKEIDKLEEEKDYYKNEIEKDFHNIIKTWDEIKEKALDSNAPSLVYEEGDIIKRTLRELVRYKPRSCNRTIKNNRRHNYFFPSSL
mgnify:CR=1 FL=1